MPLLDPEATLTYLPGGVPSRSVRHTPSTYPAQDPMHHRSRAFRSTASPLPFALLVLVALPACGGADPADPPPESAWGQPWLHLDASRGGGALEADGRVGNRPADPLEGEVHFRSLAQLTFGGTNAEAYFSPDGARVVFQATWPGVSGCDQIYLMGLDGSGLAQISTGEGRTTCGYFIPGSDRVLFSSTHHQDAACPVPPDRSQGYLWGLFSYDIYARDLVTGEVTTLSAAPGYDAEATLSPDGSTIVFTSDRSGDLEIWAMDADGSNPRQLTDELGYEGGAFFSPDGSRIVFRAFHPATEEERADYLDLLGQGLVRGGTLEIYVMDADGSNRRQVTSNGASNFAPFFHPDGERIIFSSNLHNPGGRSFNLYMVDLDGSNLRRITANEGGFDSFPMFSPDGRHLLFASSRGGQAPGEINVFLAEWEETQ